MNYLVDTDVISGGAPSKATSRDDVAGWMDSNSDRLFLSVFTIAEIEDGIAKARRAGAVRKASALGQWLDALLHLYAARILPFRLGTARIAGRLSDHARGLGQQPGLADIIIAATARELRLTVLSRNIRHFKSLDVPALDPYSSLPR